MDAVHTSKIDTWFWLVIIGAAVALLVATMHLYKLRGMVGLALMLPALLLGLGLPLWLVASTRYTLTPTELLIKCGPVALQVPIADITAITPTSNPLSSPALSLDRLRIDYGDGNSVMISPRDQQQFLRDVEARGGVVTPDQRTRR